MWVRHSTMMTIRSTNCEIIWFKCSKDLLNVDVIRIVKTGVYFQRFVYERSCCNNVLWREQLQISLEYAQGNPKAYLGRDEPTLLHRRCVPTGLTENEIERKIEKYCLVGSTIFIYLFLHCSKANIKIFGKARAS